MSTNEADQNTQTPDTDDDDGKNPVPPHGFVPPPGAAWAKFRRFDPESGMWTDSPVMLDGVATAWVPAHQATPTLPLADAIPGTYRITWISQNKRTVGASKAWRIQETAGGESNTPRMWPPGQPGRLMANAPSSLSPAEVVLLLQGLANVGTELTRPMVMQVEAFHEGALRREREFHERQRLADQASFERSQARDREFMAAMRDVHERPRDQRIAQLEAELAAIKAADAAADDEEESKSSQNAYDLAGKIVEQAPELIRTVADEIRRGGEKASSESD